MDPQLVIVAIWSHLSKMKISVMNGCQLNKPTRLNLLNLIAEKCGIQVDPTALFRCPSQENHRVQASIHEHFRNLPLLEFEIHVTRTIVPMLS